MVAKYIIIEDIVWVHSAAVLLLIYNERQNTEHNPHDGYRNYCPNGIRMISIIPSQPIGVELVLIRAISWTTIIVPGMPRWSLINGDNRFSTAGICLYCFELASRFRCKLIKIFEAADSDVSWSICEAVFCIVTNGPCWSSNLYRVPHKRKAG